MIILSIETSCDETAVSVIEAVGTFPTARYEILGNALYSQIDIHREYGGVFPALAKREHVATIVPMLEKALHEAMLPHDYTPALTTEERDHVQTLLAREPGLADQLLRFIDDHGRPPITTIAVTTGPGLEPALWVGVNVAKALAYLTGATVISTDHMEGHIYASLYKQGALQPLTFPALALLVSGGHTELIVLRDWNTYEKIGSTRDDAVGEAFDKVARLLGLPYPGGPEISRLAMEARTRSLPQYAKLPLPMLHSPDYDFSFSGLKTAVRNATQGKTLSHDEACALARDFEDVAVGVLVAKVEKALNELGCTHLIIGGGVAANQHLRSELTNLSHPHRFPDLTIYLPETTLATDNSVMIALAGHAHAADAVDAATFANERANGTKSL